MVEQKMKEKIMIRIVASSIFIYLILFCTSSTFAQITTQQDLNNKMMNDGCNMMQTFLCFEERYKEYMKKYNKKYNIDGRFLEAYMESLQDEYSDTAIRTGMSLFGIGIASCAKSKPANCDERIQSLKKDLKRLGLPDPD
jgi:hypothetical protein